MHLGESHADDKVSQTGDIRESTTVRVSQRGASSNPVPLADDDDQASLMAAADQEWRVARRGEMLEGVVVSIDRDGVLVDLGTKSEGLIPISEVQSLVDENQLKPGDTVYVVVTQPEGRSDHAMLSFSRARSERG